MQNSATQILLRCIKRKLRQH